MQCALAYLLFHEGEEFMTENVDYYREVLGHDGKPREVRICSGDVGWEGAEGLKSWREKKDVSVEGCTVDYTSYCILEQSYSSLAFSSLGTGQSISTIKEQQ